MNVSMRRNLLVVIAALCVGVLCVALAWTVVDRRAGGAGSGTGTALLHAEFALVNDQGQAVSEADFAGRFLLVYFGYTYCPDVCPLSLQEMMAAYDALPDETRAQVQPLFVTVDPERDTVAAMADYTDLFGPQLIGLTGSKEQIDAAAAAFRVYYRKVEDQATVAAYLVDHSSFIYLMGPDGAYVRHFGHGTAPEAMAAGIVEAVSETGG